MEGETIDPVKNLEALVRADTERRHNLLLSPDRERNWPYFQLTQFGADQQSRPDNQLNPIQKLQRKLNLVLLKHNAKKAGFNDEEIVGAVLLGSKAQERRQQLAELTGESDLKSLTQKLARIVMLR